MFTQLAPLLNQCKSIKLDIKAESDTEVLIIMQTSLKPLDDNASEGAKQLHGALAMPLILKAPIDDVDAQFGSLLQEYCQQHEHTHSTLETSLERIKENNKSARQSATTLDEKSSKDTPKKDAKKVVNKDTVTPPAPPQQVESVTTQSNPVSLF